MILNLLMFFGAFMTARRPFPRVIAGVIIGIVKGAAYFYQTRDPFLSLLAGAMFFAMIVGINACLIHLDNQEMGIPVYPAPGERVVKPIQWAYVPLSFLVFSVIFGEPLLAFILA